MADLLRHHTFQKDEENELARLVRIERTLKRNGDVSVESTNQSGSTQPWFATSYADGQTSIHTRLPSLP